MARRRCIVAVAVQQISCARSPSLWLARPTASNPPAFPEFIVMKPQPCAAKHPRSSGALSPAPFHQLSPHAVWSFRLGPGLSLCRRPGHMLSLPCMSYCLCSASMVVMLSRPQSSFTTWSSRGTSNAMAAAPTSVICSQPSVRFEGSNRRHLPVIHLCPRTDLRRAPSAVLPAKPRTI